MNPRVVVNECQVLPLLCGIGRCLPCLRPYRVGGSRGHGGRQLIVRKQETNRARRVCNSLNQAQCFEPHNHLVDGWPGDSKVHLDIALGGRISACLDVPVNESKVLSLLVGIRQFGHAAYYDIPARTLEPSAEATCYHRSVW